MASPLSTIGAMDDDSPSLPPDTGLGGGGGGRRRGGKVRKESEHKRRLMMNQYFDELVTLLSMVTDAMTTRKMDKTTTLHEAVKLFKLYYDLDNRGGSLKRETLTMDPLTLGYRPSYLSCGEVAMFLLNSLNAFLMVISENGRILYVTDLITSLTGHISSSMVGQLVYDCIHQDDYPIVKGLMNPQQDPLTGCSIDSSPVVSFPPRSFKCRFKIYSNDTTLVNTCRVFSCLSYLRCWKDRIISKEGSPLSPTNLEIPNGDFLSGESEVPPSCLLLIARQDDVLTKIDEPVVSTEMEFNFDMRISKEGKVLDLSQQASLILGFTSSELVGSLFFDYVDPFHLDKVSKSVGTFLSKGLGVSQPFRLATKSTRYVWIVAKGFLSYNPWNHKPDHILLQCRVLGCDEIPTECRFTQDGFYLPDLCGFETYKPEPIQEQIKRSPPKERPLPISVPRSLPLLSDNSMPQFNFQSEVPPSLNPPPPPPLTPAINTATTSTHQRSMDEVCKELERKNQELFEMQRKVLEQQKLIEQERQQFYTITNQVMSYIGSRQPPNEMGTPGGGDILDNLSIHPNMALLIRNATPPLSQSKSSSLQNLTNMSVTGDSSGNMIMGMTPNRTPMTQGHMTNQMTNQMSAQGHMGNAMMPGHMTNHLTPNHMSNPMTPGHMTNSMTPGHMTNPMTPGHMTNSMTPGHMTNSMTPGHMTNSMTPGHMTNSMTPGHMTNSMTNNMQSNFRNNPLTPSHVTNNMMPSGYSHMINSLPSSTSSTSMLPLPSYTSGNMYAAQPTQSNNPSTNNTQQHDFLQSLVSSVPTSVPSSSSSSSTHCLPLSTNISPHQVYRFY